MSLTRAFTIIDALPQHTALRAAGGHAARTSLGTPDDQGAMQLQKLPLQAAEETVPSAKAGANFSKGKDVIVMGMPVIAKDKAGIVMGMPVIVKGKAGIVMGMPVIVKDKAGIVMVMPVIAKGMAGIVMVMPVIAKGMAGIVMVMAIFFKGMTAAGVQKVDFQRFRRQAGPP